MIKFGVSLPNCCEGLIYPPPFADHNDIVNLGKESEELGYHSLWVNDHITTQNYVSKSFANPPNYYEPLITLSFIAAQTNKSKLSTGILVLPLRHPIILAKQVALLDLLSDGRIILGVGMGAYKEEFQRMFPDVPLSRRKLLLEEGIQALRLLWSQDRATFDGKFIKFQDIELFPKPKQSRIPLYLGGNSEEGLKRVARWGDGWFPAMLSPQEIEASAHKIGTYAREFGRNISDIEIAPQLTVSMGESKERAFSNFEKSFLFDHMKSLQSSTLKNMQGNFEGKMLLGTPDDIIDLVQKYVDAGVTHFGSLVIPAQTLDEFRLAMKNFSKFVMPSF